MEKMFNNLAFGALLMALLLSQDIPYSTIASNIYFCGVLIFIVYVAVRVMKRGFMVQSIILLL